jgi:hypothetical protein
MMQAVIKENCSSTLAENLFRTFLFYYGECRRLVCPVLVQSQLFTALVRTWRSALPLTLLEQMLLDAATNNKVNNRCQTSIPYTIENWNNTFI